MRAGLMRMAYGDRWAVWQGPGPIPAYQARSAGLYGLAGGFGPRGCSLVARAVNGGLCTVKVRQVTDKHRRDSRLQMRKGIQRSRPTSLRGYRRWRG
jgi:hypothetical protein